MSSAARLPVSRREDISWAQRGTRGYVAQKLGGGFGVAQGSQEVHAVAHAVVAPGRVGLSASLRMDATKVQGLATQGAGDAIRYEGHTEAEPHRVDIAVGAEYWAVCRMDAGHPRVVGGRVPQVLHTTKPWPVGISSECGVEGLEPGLSKHERQRGLEAGLCVRLGVLRPRWVDEASLGFGSQGGRRCSAARADG